MSADFKSPGISLMTKMGGERASSPGWSHLETRPRGRHMTWPHARGRRLILDCLYCVIVNDFFDVLVFVFVCVCVCACMYVCMYVPACVCVRTCLRVHECVHVCPHVYACVCVPTCMCAHVCVSSCVCMCMCALFSAQGHPECGVGPPREAVSWRVGGALPAGLTEDIAFNTPKLSRDASPKFRNTRQRFITGCWSFFLTGRLPRRMGALR